MDTIWKNDLVDILQQSQLTETVAMHEPLSFLKWSLLINVSHILRDTILSLELLTINLRRERLCEILVVVKDPNDGACCKEQQKRDTRSYHRTEETFLSSGSQVLPVYEFRGMCSVHIQIGLAVETKLKLSNVAPYSFPM